ncbi:hypothetical protein P170DRAFT_471753 [Aspergillus steynii IBT 23096]|uniref:Uncharacterized protein n=1 Tax=Aspergillus steynii IBT 23096 TaxID=1392250 RepID=A0A2I2GG70_9EURO|nr:uncharacterized protein P170DRAFT_471753 [Aspergillus steynii IBT 23096]PLB51827.1 hypothetical protein P170DRAFT_471753 [Aspergillus steynii IBT 23096]
MNLTRPRASLAYVLGTTGLASTFTVTILDGVCYAFAKSLPSHISAIESAIVSLSVISCLALFALVSIWVSDIENGLRRQWKGWRAITYGIAIAYFSLATGITAGAIAWSAVQSITEADKSHLTPKQRTLMVVRCVIWAISVLSQGLLGGYLLMSMSKRGQRIQWPSSFSQELEILPDHTSIRPSSPSKTPSLVITDSQREEDRSRTNQELEASAQPSASSAASLVSHRYSGRTLTQHESKRSSFDQNPQHPSVPEGAVTRSKISGCSDDHSQKLQRRHSEVKRSFDSLILRTASGRSSPASNLLQPEVSRGSAAPTLTVADESHIHPLFRTDSPSPAPTPTPGTVVIASPAAGQIISVKTLNRVRSTNSLRSHSTRSRSPLFERMDHPDDASARRPAPSGENSQQRDLAIPSFIMAADIRRSITRYEKKYDLHESPHES